MNANRTILWATLAALTATLAWPGTAQAQSNATDTTFFPMHQGNRWVYELWDSAWPVLPLSYTVSEIKHPVIKLDSVYSTLLNDNNPGYVAGKTLVCNETACRDRVWIDFHPDSQQLFLRFEERKIMILDFSLAVGDSLLVTGDLSDPDWMMSQKIIGRSQREFNGEMVDIVGVETTFPHLDDYGYMVSRSVVWHQKGLGRYDLGLCGECHSSVPPLLVAARINGQVLFGDITVSDGGDKADTPEGFRLEPAFPNPFNPSTTLHFALDRSGEVALEVYDMLGRRVLVRELGALQAGEHRHTLDLSGRPSGAYLVRLQAGVQVRTTRITLLK